MPPASCSSPRHFHKLQAMSVPARRVLAAKNARRHPVVTFVTARHYRASLLRWPAGLLRSSAAECAVGCVNMVGLFVSRIDRNECILRGLVRSGSDRDRLPQLTPRPYSTVLRKSLGHFARRGRSCVGEEQDERFRRGAVCEGSQEL